MWMYALFVVYLYKHSHARQMARPAERSGARCGV
jgi:hypothetical protein